LDRDKQAQDIGDTRPLQSDYVLGDDLGTGMNHTAGILPAPVLDPALDIDQLPFAQGTPAYFCKLSPDNYVEPILIAVALAIGGRPRILGDNAK
jgi:hypothetical protein